MTDPQIGLTSAQKQHGHTPAHEKSEQEFEAWWSSKMRPISAPGDKRVAKDAWTASRCALKAELPNDEFIETLSITLPKECNEVWRTGWRSGVHWLRERIAEKLKGLG